MARWKACIKLPIRHNWTFFTSSYCWGATRQNASRLTALREGRSLGAKISGGRVRPWGILFGFYKTRHILLSDSANCTGLRADVLTQYRRVTDGRTDGQTDGIAIASIALAMQTLWRAVKIGPIIYFYDAINCLQETPSQNTTFEYFPWCRPAATSKMKNIDVL